MNPASTQSCEMCTTSRPAQQSPASPPKGMFGHQPGDGAGLGWSPATAGLYSSAQGLFGQFSSAVLDRDQDRAIIQLKSVYQQRSSACGYHSVFNTESVFELMSMMSVDASEVSVCRRVFSSVLFTPVSLADRCIWFRLRAKSQCCKNQQRSRCSSPALNQAHQFVGFAGAVSLPSQHD